MSVLVYLGAVVAANLISAKFGPWASVVTAFAFIGLTLTLRDRLHDKWKERRWLYLGGLILSGSIISYLINQDALPIARASCIAFAASEAVDSIVYHLNRRSPWLHRVNRSNVSGAVVDSILFPTLAFGGFMPLVTLAQIAAKILGGYFASLALRPKVAAVAAVLAFSILPVKSHAQFISAGVAVVDTPLGTNLALESVAAAPRIAFLTPNVIVSWSRGGSYEPVLIPQAGVDLVTLGPTVLGVDAGVIGGPWDDYEGWNPNATLRAIRFIGGPWKVIGLASTDPSEMKAWTFVLKIDRTLIR